MNVAVHTGSISVWTVFFMQKLWKRVLFFLVLAIAAWCGSLIADKRQLSQELIRLHVVANSDSAEDQSIKLQVRDVVIKSIQKDLQSVSDIKEARKYLQEKIPEIQKAADTVLEAAGFEERTTVTLCIEEFPVRAYETFTLPSGIYESLRIKIGKAVGKNWWCVVFPELCTQATTAGVLDLAACSGFSESLNGAITGEQKYSVRFFLLDAIGKLENILYLE